MDAIHEKTPRETIGRDTTSRFRMQFQAAAYAALEILSGQEVDRVYCDYHDDFVVRRNIDGFIEYHFFQVKTKGRANQQWTVNEIFSLQKKSPLDTTEKLKALRDSIAGKLFIHTIEFGEQCREVTILSNVHFQDGVYEIIDHLKAGESNQKHIQQLIEKFETIFSPSIPLSAEKLIAARSKLSLIPNVSYVGDTPEAFSDAARIAIWKYSEIDLQKHEIDEIANSLVTLITSKSCGPIQDLSKKNIDRATSVGLEDLLGVLSISTEVYNNLLAGGDPAVIKSASILQRQLKTAGATDGMIEAASRAKASWDVWLRKARHTFPEFALEVLIGEIDKKCIIWLISGGQFPFLQTVIQDMCKVDSIKRFSSLDTDVLFGGFCSSIVRRASR